MRDRYYIKMKSYNPLNVAYGYLDKDNKADHLFEKAGIKLKNKRTFINDNGWQFMLCSFGKKDEEKFQEVMDELKNGLLVCGVDFEEVDELMKAFDGE